MRSILFLAQWSPPTLRQTLASSEGHLTLQPAGPERAGRNTSRPFLRKRRTPRNPRGPARPEGAPPSPAYGLQASPLPGAGSAELDCALSPRRGSREYLSGEPSLGRAEAAGASVNPDLGFAEDFEERGDEEKLATVARVRGWAPSAVRSHSLRTRGVLCRRSDRVARQCALPRRAYGGDVKGWKDGTGMGRL